jgi:ATP-dependent RNA helicase DeaD
MDNFRKLGISEPILKSIKDEMFENPSDIQEKSIPLILKGRDVIAGSATGSGKTLAFACGIIENSEKGKGIQALILTPTRELAEQVAQSLKTFSKYRPLGIIAVYGGVGINPQITGLRKADVVVGTPGRILDHIERKTIKFNNVKTLVLDEADRMFDMGFKDDVERIIKRCPQDRQTLLFSATTSKELVRLTKNHMDNPVEVSVDSYVDPKKLCQTYYNITDELKFSLLVHLLKHETSSLAMVFCNSKRNTDKVAKNLGLKGFSAGAIHGGLSQNRRTDVLKQFHNGETSILVCTDVAARGLDIHGVSHVYNYDIPRESKQYIHRIGRTARAGAEGKAINILAQSDYDNFSRVLKENDVEITEEVLPNIEKIVIRQPDTNKRKPITGNLRKGQKPNQRQRNRY